MKAITVQMLRDAIACEWQVEIFRKTFGESAEVTEANCLRAVQAGLNVAWAAGKFGAMAAFDAVAAPALAEYKAVTEPAWAERWDADEQAWEKYQAAGFGLAAWNSFRAARSEAEATFDAATVTARAKYWTALARALYEACRGDD